MIILAQREWSSTKDVGPIFKRCNARQQQTFFNMVNVYVFNIGSICIHGKELLNKFTFHQNTGNNLTMKQIFDISDKLIVRQSDEIYGVTPINWEDSLWKQLSLISDEEVISLSHAKVYVFFRFCVMPWKDESKPNTKFCMGRKVELVQEFITMKNFGHNWWWADGIRVEYFPRIHHIIWRTNHLHVDVQWHLMGIWRQWTGMQC